MGKPLSDWVIEWRNVPTRRDPHAYDFRFLVWSPLLRHYVWARFGQGGFTGARWSSSREAFGV
jgi:hypothetical protein